MVQKHSFPTVRYFNGILFVFTSVFLKCAHYSTDFGTQMLEAHWIKLEDTPLTPLSASAHLTFISLDQQLKREAASIPDVLLYDPFCSS